MKKTKVIRVDSDLAEIIEQGRRVLQSGYGKKISTSEYTSQLVQIMKPIIYYQSQAEKVGYFGLGGRGKRPKRP